MAGLIITCSYARAVSLTQGPRQLLHVSVYLLPVLVLVHDFYIEFASEPYRAGSSQPQTVLE
jgi:hypothetical protein